MAPGVILQHSPSGPPGRLGEWARERGIAFRVHRSWQTEPDFDPAQVGWIASLGSAHSVNDPQPAWIATEVTLLARAVAAGTPVLGLCWGGQALAVALGGVVGPASAPEIGWLALASTDPVIPEGPWLHYHSEIFTVPGGATELARTPVGPGAFALGPHLGLQFHPEADAATAAGWAARDANQTTASRAALAAAGARWDPPARALAFTLFDGWFASMGDSGGAGASG